MSAQGLAGVGRHMLSRQQEMNPCAPAKAIRALRTCQESDASHAQPGSSSIAVSPTVREAAVAGGAGSCCFGLGDQLDHKPGVDQIDTARDDRAEAVAKEVSGIAVGSITALTYTAFPQAPQAVCEQGYDE